MNLDLYDKYLKFKKKIILGKLYRLGIVIKNKITLSVTKLSRIKLMYLGFCKYAKTQFGIMLKIISGLIIRTQIAQLGFTLTYSTCIHGVEKRTSIELD